MILFCPFCRKCPDITHGIGGSTCFIECCGVNVACMTSVGTERRWNEIAKAVTSRRSWLLRKRMERKMKPLTPEQFRTAMNASREAIESAGRAR
jgi:hypothetical protein